MAQQKVLLAQQRNAKLLELHEEIERLASARRFHCFRLVKAIRKGDQELAKARMAEFDKTVVQWNERYSSFLSRLRIFRSFYEAIRLENNIHSPLVMCSEMVAAAYTSLQKSENTSSHLEKIEESLQDVNGSIIAFSRDYLNIIEKDGAVIIDPDEMDFLSDTLEFFSTLFLIKALFKRREIF
jgi:predicted translin family RNA/ssDNA-binding protein